LVKPTVDKFAAVVGEKRYELVSCEGFRLGKEVGEDLERVGLVLHWEDTAILQVSINDDFQEVLVAASGDWGDGST
jgi:hypothetical protein